MDRKVELKRRLRDLVNAQRNHPLHGRVTAVNGDTCSVLIGGLELSNIRLKSTTGGDNRLLITPKIGTDVTLLSSDGTIDNLSVIIVDRIAKLELKEADFRLEIDCEAKKLGFGNSETNIYQLMDDLQQLLKQLKVHTPSGPSGTPLPDSIARIEQFESDFKKILMIV